MNETNKVAIIDDDPNIIEIFGTKLKNEGFQIATATDGQAGLEMVMREKPAIILLDIMMPVKNGVEVLNDLQNNPETSRIPVIILSNNSDEMTIKQVSQFATHFYVVKSLTTPQKLAGLVKEVLYGEK
jgi:two-component system phosphate regulon response regulator PhoB